MDTRTLKLLQRIEEAIKDCPTARRIDITINLDLHDDIPADFNYEVGYQRIDVDDCDANLYSKNVSTDKCKKEICFWIPN
jgi:hypothetical protein